MGIEKNSYIATLFCYIVILLLFSGCVDSKPPISKPSSDQQPRPLNEESRLLVSSYVQNAKFAVEQKQLDTAVYWYEKAGDLFIEHQQWDSLHQVTIDAFYACYDAFDYTALKSVLANNASKIPPEQDTALAKQIEFQGYVAFDEGETEQSLGYYKKAKDIWKKYPVSHKLAGCYNMLGVLYHMLEDYPLAEQIYREGVKISHQLNDTLGERKSSFNLGRVLLSQGHWEEAIKYTQLSQDLLPRTDGAFETQMAAANLFGGQVDKALTFAQKGLNVALRFEGRGASNLDLAYQTLGDAYLKSGQVNKALTFYQSMMKVALETYPAGHREIAKAHIFLGNAYRQQQSWNLALQEYQHAIEIFLPAFQSKTLLDCPSGEQLLSREGYLMEALRDKGDVLLEKYHHSGQLKMLQAADKHFENAVQLINQIRLFHTELEAKTFYGRDYAIPYAEAAINTKLLLFQKSADPIYQKEAFLLSQQANAFLLRESINEQQALAKAFVPTDTISLLKALNAQIKTLQSANAEASTVLIADSLTHLIFNIKNQRLDLLEAIEKNYPEYYQLKHKLSPISLDTLQKALAPNSLVLKYFMGKDKFYTFAFTKKTLKTFTTLVDPSFFQSVQQYRRSLSDLDYIRSAPKQAEKEFIESSRELYSSLLQPAIEHFATETFSKLTIIPSGILNYLSFECMLTKPVNNWLQKDAFVVSQYPVRYAYFTGLLLPQVAQEVNEKSRYVGFGTTYSDSTLEQLNLIVQDSISNPALNESFRGKKLSKLLFADDEVDEIARLLAGKAFLNKEATKVNFLQHSPNYDVIHIAAHSFIDAQNDSTAYIVFNQDDSNDYLLSLQEIYNLDLDADLVALSSCQSSLGQLERGEGLMSLARAFKFAGSESIIASQWSIPDQSSFYIMNSFYELLQKGLPKDEALQQAKMNYLNNDQVSSPAYRIPAYWGAIVVIGNEQPLIFEVVNRSYYYWLGGIFLLIFIVFFLRRN